MLYSTKIKDNIKVDKIQALTTYTPPLNTVAYPGIFFGGEGQQIQLRTEMTGIWGL